MYTCVPMTEKHVQEASEIFAAGFCRHNAYAKELKLEEKNYKEFACERIRFTLPDGLSFVIYDGEKMIGAALVADAASPSFTSTLPIVKQLAPSIELGEQLWKSANVSKYQYKKGEAGKVILAASHPDFLSQRLSVLMVKYITALLQKLGYSKLVSETFHNHSGETMKKAGSKVLASIKAEEFQRSDGSRPYARLAGQVVLLIEMNIPTSKL